MSVFGQSSFGKTLGRANPGLKMSSLYFSSAPWSTWVATLETWPESGTSSPTAFPPLSRGLSPTTSQRVSQMCGGDSVLLSSKLPHVSKPVSWLYVFKLCKVGTSLIKQNHVSCPTWSGPLFDSKTSFKFFLVPQSSFRSCLVILSWLFLSFSHLVPRLRYSNAMTPFTTVAHISSTS